MALASRAGNSCHLCHTGFLESKLFFCSANKKNGRGCRKKICDRCLSRKFPDLYKPEDKMLNKWKCPSCLNRCPCASCRMCDHGCSRKRCLDQTCSHYRNSPSKDQAPIIIPLQQGIGTDQQAFIPYQVAQSGATGVPYAIYYAPPTSQLPCRSCGHFNAATAKFCINCGTQQQQQAQDGMPATATTTPIAISAPGPPGPNNPQHNGSHNGPQPAQPPSPQASSDNNVAGLAHSVSEGQPAMKIVPATPSSGQTDNEMVTPVLYQYGAPAHPTHPAHPAHPAHPLQPTLQYAPPPHPASLAPVPPHPASLTPVTYVHQMVAQPPHVVAQPPHMVAQPPIVHHVAYDIRGPHAVLHRNGNTVVCPVPRRLAATQGVALNLHRA